jgi:hypothetical protein
MDKFTVRDATGSVDVLGSATKYAEALQAWCAEHEVDSDTIETAVEAVFDRFDGKRMSVPALIGYAVTELAASPEQHKALTARVHAYMKGQKETGRLEVTLGPKGGIARMARPGEPIPVKESKAAK